MKRTPLTVSEYLVPLLVQEQQRGNFSSLDESLDSLLSQLVNLPARRVKFRVSGHHCEVIRLSDRRYVELCKTSIAIKTFDEIVGYQMRRGALQLAETFAACSLIFGKRGRIFDDWKGSFSFPLAFEIENSKQSPCVLLNLQNYRSGIDFGLRQVVAANDPRLNHPYLYGYEAVEFPSSLMTELLFHLIGFIEGFATTCQWDEPFVLSVQSNAIVYGYSAENKFFNLGFETCEQFHAADRALREYLPTPGYYQTEK